MSYSLFFTPEIEIYSDDVTDPMSSTFVQSIFNEETTYEVVSHKVDSATLNDGDSKTIPLLGTVLADRKFIIIKVTGPSSTETGEAHVTTVGKDFNGTTDITGVSSAIGTELYPGYIVLTTYNITSITIEADADDTEVQIFASKIEV